MPSSPQGELVLLKWTLRVLLGTGGQCKLGVQGSVADAPRFPAETSSLANYLYPVLGKREAVLSTIYWKKYNNN